MNVMAINKRVWILFIMTRQKRASPGGDESSPPNVEADANMKAEDLMEENVSDGRSTIFLDITATTSTSPYKP